MVGSRSLTERNLFWLKQGLHDGLIKYLTLFEGTAEKQLDLSSHFSFFLSNFCRAVEYGSSHVDLLGGYP